MRSTTHGATESQLHITTWALLTELLGHGYVEPPNKLLNHVIRQLNGLLNITNKCIFSIYLTESRRLRNKDLWGFTLATYYYRSNIQEHTITYIHS